MHTACRLATGLALASALCAPVYAQQDPHGTGEQPHIDPVYAGLPPPPEAMERAYDRFDAGQRALDQADDPHVMAVPASRSISVSLSAGAQINIIRIAQGYPTALTFLDRTGQPWPIAWDISTNKAAGCGQNGEGHNASVRPVGINACVPEPGSNVLQITPLSRYPRGGVLVSLKDAPKPISFMIIAGVGTYDADLTARVNGRGPKARDIPGPEHEIPETGSSLVNSFFNGTPPAEAVPLLVSGVSPDRMRAWKIKDTMYLLTSYTVVSPAPIADQSEFDSTLFVIPASPEVLVSAGERKMTVTLSEDGP